MGVQTALAEIVGEEFLSEPGVRRLTSPRRGHVLFAAGALAREIFYIESGLIKLEHATGEQNVLIGVLGPGQFCGEAALVGEAHQVTATTMEASTVLAIPTDTFQRVCDRRPEVWRAVLSAVLECSAELQRRFVQLCLSDVRERILYQLDVLAKLIPSGAPAVIHISQSELASMVGATRETTSTTLNALAREGVVTLGHRKLLLNRDARAMKAASAGV